MPPRKLRWHDDRLKPPFSKDLEPNRGIGDVIYLGDKGTLMNHRLVPETKMQAYGKPARKLERSVGHYKEFVDACRGGAPAGASFVDHAGLLTEVCMLGNVALRPARNWPGTAPTSASPTTSQTAWAAGQRTEERTPALTRRRLAHGGRFVSGSASRAKRRPSARRRLLWPAVRGSRRRDRELWSSSETLRPVNGPLGADVCQQRGFAAVRTRDPRPHPGRIIPILSSRLPRYDSPQKT